MLSLLTPGEVGKSLADRSRALRLGANWTRQTLAERAGVTVASLRRFEETGKASLELVLRLAHALGRLEEFSKLLQPPAARSIEDLERMSRMPVRKRGRL